MKFFAAVLLVVGVALTYGGVQLAGLGGSPFFLAAGIGFLLSGLLSLRSDLTLACYVYAVLLLATLLWSLSETGMDWWPLASRTGLPLLLGIPLLFVGSRVRRPAGRVMLGVWAVGAAVTLGSIANDKHSIQGQLASASKVTKPDMGGIPDDAWTSYGRSQFGQRYSPLEQITVDNVTDLELAWQVQIGDKKGPNDVGETTYEVTPIKVGASLFLCTPHHWLVALDADSGEKQWVFNPQVGLQNQRQHQTCRGVSYLPPRSSSIGETQRLNVTSNDKAEQLPAKRCDAQLFLPTSDARLIALDPATGARCSNFGINGELDLMHNMPATPPGYYYSTSPPVVVNGLVVIAGAVNDNYNIDSPSGVIRAYSARSGKLVWNWDSGNPDATQPIAAGDTYTMSSPNSWSTASADAELGLVYFPMGNRTPDQLGTYRSPEEERFSSSVVALHADTGKLAWVQQFVHHDLWDMDTPAQPSLIDLQTSEGMVPGLVIPTKQGDIYVLNRKTGEPIMPITEQPAPKGAMKGDFSSPTQPHSALSFNPPALEESDMWGATLIDQLVCRIQFKKLRYEGRYTPPSEQGTIVYPGNFGVFNWGSIAVDPERQALFGMPLTLAFVSTIQPKSDPGYSDKGTNSGEHGVNANAGAPYAVELKPFMSPIGVPCQQPPWGYVAGVDLTTGDVAWMHKNGTVRDLTPLPLPFEMGVPGIGGPMITGGGVVFMGAAADNYIRAYNLTNGDELWRARLPAGGQATPMTYLNNDGEQMLVIVAGGHGSIGTKIGDYVMAYKLAN